MTAEPVERPRVARTPSQQNSIVPLGWKPTKAQPVPVIRCVHFFDDGEQCDRWSIRGYSKCVKHSAKGSFSNVELYANAIVEATRLRMFGTLDEAVDVLQDLMRNATAEGVKLKATTELMDRCGLRGGVDLNVNVEVQDNAGELLRQRINDLQNRVKIIDGDTVVPTPNEEEPRDG